MIKTGLDVKLKKSVKRVLKNGDGSLNVILNDGHIVQTDQCLVAMSRPPLLNGLSLDNTAILVKTGIMVDEFHQTGVDGIYAIGNVTEKCGQAPVA